MLYWGPLGVVSRRERVGVSYLRSVRITNKSEENLWSRWGFTNEAADNFRPGLCPRDLGFVRADWRPHAGRRGTRLQPDCLGTLWAQVRTLLSRCGTRSFFTSAYTWATSRPPSSLHPHLGPTSGLGSLARGSLRVPPRHLLSGLQDYP